MSSSVHLLRETLDLSISMIIDQPLLILRFSKSHHHHHPIGQPIQTLEMSYSEAKTLEETMLTLEKAITRKQYYYCKL